MDAAVLVADAEPETRGLLERRLPVDGFAIAASGEPFDVVLAGDVERVERWVESAPVILLGRRRSQPVDRVRALRRGCDDYLELPFDYDELVERIRAVLRRTRPREPEVIEAGPVVIETTRRRARLGQTPLVLSQKEYELLVMLAQEPERVFTRAELLRDVWGYRSIVRTRTLDSHASRLRRKLHAAGAEVELVDNVWGVGYRLLGDLPLG
jgi:DNA-binding response OmpR family regulator